MTGIFGFRIRYSDGMEHYAPFPPESAAETDEIQPVVFTAKAPFYIDDRFPASLVVRREGAPIDVWWPITEAINLGLATTTERWVREVSGRA